MDYRALGLRRGQGCLILDYLGGACKKDLLHVSITDSIILDLLYYDSSDRSNEQNSHGPPVGTASGSCREAEGRAPSSELRGSRASAALPPNSFLPSHPLPFHILDKLNYVVAYIM